VYAYSRFRVGAKVDKAEGPAPGIVGTIHEYENIEPGETITQEQAGVDDEGWQRLQDEGAIGEEPWPDDINPGEPLNRYRLRKAAEAMDAATNPTAAAETRRGLSGGDQAEQRKASEQGANQ
jgi:hypothetical protein